MRRHRISVADLNTLLHSLDQASLLQLSIQTLRKPPAERT